MRRARVWTVSQLTRQLVTYKAIGRCFRSLLWTPNAVVRPFSILNRFTLALFWLRLQVNWKGVCISEYYQWEQWNLECYRRVINRRIGQRLWHALLWLGNPQTSGRVVGLLTRAPATAWLTLDAYESRCNRKQQSISRNFQILSLAVFSRETVVHEIENIQTLFSNNSPKKHAADQTDIIKNEFVFTKCNIAVKNFLD